MKLNRCHENWLSHIFRRLIYGATLFNTFLDRIAMVSCIISCIHHDFRMSFQINENLTVEMILEL